MRRALLRIQTAAADRWSFVEHPRLYRVPGRRKREWIDVAFRWGLAAWILWLIFGSIAFWLLVGLITLIG